MILGLGGFLVWAATAPLDEGVPTTGSVSIDTKRKPVQHPNGGIIREVLVKEGQTVAQGDVLIRLDDANTKANFESIRQGYLGLRVRQSRLLAEDSGSGRITHHRDVIAAAAEDPLIARQVATQEKLLRSRRAALEAEVLGLQESIAGQRAQIAANESVLKSRRLQRALLEEEFSHTKSLVEEGYAPRNKRLELERMLAESAASIAELEGSLQRTKRTIAELEARTLQRKQEYRKEVETELAEVTRQVDADADKLAAMRAEFDRVEMRAPVTGQVVGLAVQSPGAVIQAGQKLMDVVPEVQSLLLEAKVPPNLIDRIKIGQEADIRFSTFSHSPQLVVEGRLDSISGDLLTDPQDPRITYYLARVSVTPAGMKSLGTHQMQAGMPAEIIIRTGERTLLKYLLHPLTKRIAAAMKEE